MIEISVRVAGEQALGRIDAWLKANVSTEWHLEFGGIDDAQRPGPERRKKPRLLVRYRFVDPKDAEKFRQAYLERRILEPEQRTPSPLPAGGPRGKKVLSGLSRAMQRLFARPGRKAAPSILPLALSAIGLVSVDAFSSRVADIVRNGQPASASKVQMIGLDRLQARFGANWVNVAERADEIARRTIQSRLSRTDIYTAVQGWKYLILFPELSVVEAQLKSALIADEIARAIVGDQDVTGEIEVKSAMLAAGGGLTFEQVPTLANLVQMLSQKVEPPCGTTDGNSVTGPDAERVEPPPFVLDPLDAAEVWYQPMLDTRANAVAAYQAVPAFEMPDGTRVFGEAHVPDFDHPDRIFRLDLMLLSRAIRELNASIGSGRKKLILVGVNFETLAANAKRMEYLRRLESVLWPARGLLAFQIKNLPDGASPARLHELVMSLKRHTRVVVLQFPTNTNYVSIYRDIALQSVGIELNGGAATLQRDLLALQRFAMRARKAGIPAFAGGLSTQDLAGRAVEAGYRYVIGNGIAPPLRSLAAAPHFRLRVNERPEQDQQGSKAVAAAAS